MRTTITAGAGCGTFLQETEGSKKYVKKIINTVCGSELSIP
jgi:hypothetical protein